MQKKTITTAFAAAALSFSAYAADSAKTVECKVNNSEGQGVIREGRGDCGGENNSCAGQNKAGDPKAWILVSKEVCDKLNEGKLDEVSAEVRSRIDESMIRRK